MTLLSGVDEGVPYSLSRYTDVPNSKWPWFQACLEAQKMVAFDPRKASAPGVWSLQPEDTLGLVFWTKNPTNLLLSQELLKPYQVTVHVTATGWSEVEKGTPTLEQAGQLLIKTAKSFKQVYWRFSPVPMLPTTELFRRFQLLLGYASVAGIKQVYLSFLQPNDKLPESRAPQERFNILNTLADEAKAFGIQTILCRDDRSLDGFKDPQFVLGPCVQPVDFGGQAHVQLENCGCVAMVDPFTVNESCGFGCDYCYSADKTLSEKKRNTTRLYLVR